jgi:hypothetical protein
MSDTIDDVLQRLARLEDLEAIRHTWLDYCMRLDSADWTVLGDVFTEDGVRLHSTIATPSAFAGHELCHSAIEVQKEYV